MDDVELPTAQAIRAANALWRARDQHVATLVDVAGPPGGPLHLIVDAGATPLQDVLAGGLPLGAAVTMLVPLAERVEALGRMGVVHGAIGVGAVQLDARGAPVLGRFEQAVVAPDADQLVDDAIVDRAAYRELAIAILRSTIRSAGSADALDAAIAAAASLDASAPGAIDAFAERMLELATPMPVPLGEPVGRVRTVLGATPDEPGRSVPPYTPGLRRTATLTDRLRKVRARLGNVRARFWVVAGASAAGLVVVAFLADSPAGAPDADETGRGMPTAVLETASPPAASSRASPMRVEGLSRASIESTEPASDPVSAVLALVDSADEATLVDDYGDVVLLDVRTGASTQRLLIERTETGWRLRETLPEPKR